MSQVSPQIVSFSDMPEITDLFAIVLEKPHVVPSVSVEEGIVDVRDAGPWMRIPPS
jgi:hypothetical protein